MRLTPLLFCALLFGCGVAGKKTLVATGIKGETSRDEMFEATLLVLDEHPEYVDEFFEKAMQHPKTLGRFIERTAARLNDPGLSGMTARALAKNPDSLRQILIDTLESAGDDKAALTAIASAIGEKPSLASKAMLTRPATIRAVTEVLVLQVAKVPAARDAMNDALRNQKVALGESLASDPPTLKALVGQLMTLAEQDPKLAAILIHSTVSALDGKVLSKVTGEELAKNPQVMTTLLVSSLDATAQSPEAQKAVAAAIGQRPEVAAGAIAKDPEALKKTMIAAIDAAMADPTAKDAMLAAMRERSDALTDILKGDRKTLLKMLKDFVR